VSWPLVSRAIYCEECEEMECVYCHDFTAATTEEVNEHAETCSERAEETNDRPGALQGS
jgi:hypothetical protein